MELIAALVIAGPLGYFARTRRAGLIRYLVVWTVIFPIQTVVVHSEDASDINWSYWVLNAVFLAAGIGINRYASKASAEGRTVGRASRRTS
jgi:hypothetical protein